MTERIKMSSHELIAACIFSSIISLSLSYTAFTCLTKLQNAKAKVILRVWHNSTTCSVDTVDNFMSLQHSYT